MTRIIGLGFTKLFGHTGPLAPVSFIFCLDLESATRPRSGNELVVPVPPFLFRVACLRGLQGLISRRAGLSNCHFDKLETALFFRNEIRCRLCSNGAFVYCVSLSLY